MTKTRNNRNGRLVYWLLGAMFVITTAALGGMYSTVSRRLDDVATEQARRTGRIAILEAKGEFSERSDLQIESRLNRLEAEMLAVKLALAQRSR